MQREILFRGIDIITGEWVKGYLFLITKHSVQKKSLVPCIQVVYPNNLNHISYEVTPESVGQFTGLTDKNGVKIFEGDIVSLDNEFNLETSEVAYEKGGFIVEADFGYFDETTIGWAIEMMYEVEVIGNITDNPELLK